jgi:hypothetical protein
MQKYQFENLYSSKKITSWINRMKTARDFKDKIRVKQIPVSIINKCWGQQKFCLVGIQYLGTALKFG